jgi:hypothetical protein
LTSRKSNKLAIVAGLAGAVLMLARTGQTQLADERLAPLDAVAAHVARLEENPHFRPELLYGSARNLVSMADRWSTVRPLLKQLANDSEPAPNAVSIELANAFLTGGKPISKVTLGASRYSGFTQSETSTAWCGASVVVGFNDTGSEIRTILGQGGRSVLGYSNSVNRGVAFSYVGAPPATSNSNQAMLGEPSLACADSSNFYYASIWSDDVQSRSGVAIAKSVDGGKTFAAPSIAIAKPPFSHIVDHDWLAIDRSSPANLYVVYLDLDFSGGVCGVDRDNQVVPRYAIESISSTDGGSAWSVQPTVIEEECANQSNPSVSLGGPEVAVGPGGEVYVAWEAIGENGGSLTAREIRTAKSIDHGTTFAAPITVAPVTVIGNGADLQGFVRSSEFPSLAIGTGKANSGVIYLSWSTAGFSIPDAITTIGSYGFADVMFSQSTTGASWSAPVRVNNNPEGGSQPLSDQFQPSIGTDKTGKIGICFYDRRRDLNNFLIDRYCASSKNGGASWTNIKITPANFASLVGQDELVAPDYMSDYNTVASDGLGQSAGLIDSYSSNAAGNPNVMTNRF